MPFNMNTAEKVDGGWSFVDQGGEPLPNPEGWSATFESASPDVVVIESWESDPANAFNRTFRSGKVGFSIVTSVVTGPNGETFTGSETVNVINSAPGVPVFTFGTVRPE
jgi:hypothetical protein